MTAMALATLHDKPAAPKVARISDIVRALQGIQAVAGDIPVTILKGQGKGGGVVVRSMTSIQVGEVGPEREKLVILHAKK